VHPLSVERNSCAFANASEVYARLQRNACC